MFFLPVTSERDNQTTQNSLCSIIMCVLATLGEICKARNSRNTATIFTHKITRRVVLASLCKHTASSQQCSLVHDGSFSCFSSQLSSMKRRSVSHFHHLSTITHNSRTLHSEFCTVWLSFSDITGKKKFAN